MFFIDLRSFVPPDDKVFANFRLDKLTPADAEIDFQALTENAKTIHSLLNIDWPTGEETLEENIEDLKRHEMEFEEKISFVYGIWDVKRENYLGCLYLYFEQKHWFKNIPNDCNCVVEAWMIEGIVQSGLYNIIMKEIKSWVLRDWPLSKVHFVNKF